MNMIAQALAAVTVLVSGQDWSVKNAAHPLWEALNVPVVKVEHRYLDIEEKETGGLFCRKTEAKLKKGTDLETTCTIPRQPSAAQVQQIYKALNTEEINTSGAYTDMKIVGGRLIVISDSDRNEENNDSRIYLEHACSEVAGKTDAAKCMEFWATEVLPSFEEPNGTAVVAATAENIEKVKAAMQLNGYGAAAIVRAAEQLKDGAFIGMMEEHQDEHHFYYFAIKKGEGAVPVEFSDVNEADAEYSPLGEQAKLVKPAEVEDFVAAVMDTVFLGEDPQIFSHFSEGLRERIRDLNEEANEQ